jgi:hypothetical protein
MQDVVILIGVTLGSLFALLNGALMLFSPALFRRFFHWWGSAQIRRDGHAGTSNSQRAVGLVLTIASLNFLARAVPRLLRELGGSTPIVPPRIIAAPTPSPSTGTYWALGLVGIACITFGTALLVAPQKTVGFLWRDWFSEEFIHGPRANVRFRILGTAFAVMGTLALGNLLVLLNS